MRAFQHFLYDTNSPEFRLKCRELVYDAASLLEVKKYIDSILSRLECGERQAVPEAINLALPLVYRLGLDDTSTGYRVASKLKEIACKLMYPEFYVALTSEVDLLYRSYCGTTFDSCDAYLQRFIHELSESVSRQGFTFRSYGRRKTPYSIFEKLVRYAIGDKDLKNQEARQTRSLKAVLGKFESNLENTMKGSRQRFDYKDEEIQWIVPDLFAMTIQFPNTFVKSQNLGTTKRRYLSVFNKIATQISGDIYFGPSFSSKWHMNRLVFYVLFTPDNTIRLPVEVFLRTDYDYNIGYANYWRYKGVKILETKTPDDFRKRAELFKKIKSCHDYGAVQEVIFRELTTGQLTLW